MIAVSCTTRVNPGVLALVLAWLIGVCPPSLCERPVELRTVVAGFAVGQYIGLRRVPADAALAAA